MTIVLQHQFEDLVVDEDTIRVKLFFYGIMGVSSFMFDLYMRVFGICALIDLICALMC